MLDIAEIAATLNRQASEFKIGKLQSIRSSLTKRRRAASVIFDRRTIFKDYAFHYGGRAELQFNIGFESAQDAVILRYGVAFSFELSQALPDIHVLLPKADRFGKYVSSAPEDFSDLRMWYHQLGRRSSDFAPGLIPPELVVPGTFVFLGARCPAATPDFGRILSLFDRLLPLYRYVEGGSGDVDNPVPQGNDFDFRPGCGLRSGWTRASTAERVLDVRLRHNELQLALYDQLVRRFGADRVAAEIPNGLGFRMDVAVRQDGGLWIYEIKNGSSARECIRQAIGQLLEYALWPGAPTAEKLIVVGESRLDDHGREYLRVLNQSFPLPLEYEQIEVEARGPRVPPVSWTSAA